MTTAPTSFTYAHRGAGPRRVVRVASEQGRSTYIGVPGYVARVVAGLAVAAVLIALGLVGRADIAAQCFDAMHTDVVSVEHGDTVATCVEEFGPRGY